jgi:predicted ArsR family transcriptional regulator
MNSTDVRSLTIGRRRGTPSPSASDINQRIIELLHQAGELSAPQIADGSGQVLKELKSRLGTLTRMGLLRAGEDADGTATYRLTPSGERARQAAYLSVQVE